MLWQRDNCGQGKGVYVVEVAIPPHNSHFVVVTKQKSFFEVLNKKKNTTSNKNAT